MGAKAVAVNLTATEVTGPGFVTAWPTGQSQPPTSSLNLSGAGETAANGVVVAVGVGGNLNLVTQPGAHLVADVTGYFTSAAATTDGRFQAPATPTRALDTRTGLGGKSTPFLGGDAFDLHVAGVGGVPGGATAVAVTVTYTNVATPGFVTVWPTGQPRPPTSTSNPNGPGDIRSNLALVAVGAGGDVSLYSSGRTDVVIDVVGWFTTRTGSQGLFTVVSPQRVADSRCPARRSGESRRHRGGHELHGARPEPVGGRALQPHRHQHGGRRVPDRPPAGHGPTQRLGGQLVGGGPEPRRVDHLVADGGQHRRSVFVQRGWTPSSTCRAGSSSSSGPVVRALARRVARRSGSRRPLGAGRRTGAGRDDRRGRIRSSGNEKKIVETEP